MTECRIEMQTPNGWADVTDDCLDNIEITYGRDREDGPVRPASCVLRGGDPSLSEQTVRVIVTHGDVEFVRFVGKPQVA